ncbi:hypothetical protein BAUCODRAFT_525199 [Baudoinia panamericana UAMH 10762]|uniref:Uncharacterized protein n=1 Tax=Baudoinia panamericana (strain UAMH 10762) TaxID=717646 RepID=M2MER8_BAUPA|nr:uncharacterized protein BAUCODRAFT_525199 [Baudoinia panamericana UAMH 10762]EMC95076.1 hypothetical protein BAUCODRAFT_525199 [Baudoinia panamericana UAMH 10762]
MVARQLRLLLLSSTATAEASIGETLHRIQHFAALTGGQDLAIVFLLSPPPATTFTSAKAVMDGRVGSADGQPSGIIAYAKLQAVLANRMDIPYIPILPLSKLDDLSGLVQNYVAQLSRTRFKPVTKRATPFGLLQLCTSNPPMPQQTAYVLSDLFRDFRDLAVACTSATPAPESSSLFARAAPSQELSSQTAEVSSATQLSDTRSGDRLAQLRDLIGKQECREIVDFWWGEMIDRVGHG